MPKSVPVAASSPAPATAPLATAPASTTPPALVLKPPAPTPPRADRDIKNEGNMEMPGRTRDEVRVVRDALQEYAHRHGVLSTMQHAALVSMLATRESNNKIVRQHSAPKDPPDLPTAHIPDLSTPSSVSGFISCSLATSNECIGSCDLGISLEVFVDADYASTATNRRSVSGGATMCGGACVCWFSRTQKCVILSTSEAEYVAPGDVVKDLLLSRQVWRFMIPGKGVPCFPVFEDHQDALQLSNNPVSNSNSKHIDFRIIS